MSGTEERNRRYMKAFVYLPVALHPGPRRALLISYGVGSTARALLDTPGVERVDVVDISREILETSELLHASGADPLEDPRVRVHVEDGRYFLQVTDERYDLITGEPPPPKIAGVVNLYTREYFRLIHDRLADGGLSTYWLPVHNLTEQDTKAILRAFCDVFDDCSLWAGSGLDWIMMGTRAGSGPASEAAFVRQWQTPAVAEELRALGFEHPATLAATFLADADRLRLVTGDTPPLIDDFPKRLSNALVDGSRLEQIYGPWMDTEGAWRRFSRSPQIAGTWPPCIATAARVQFEHQRMINEADVSRWSVRRLADLHRVLTGSELRTLVLWLLEASGDQVRAVERAIERGSRAGDQDALLGFRALADREFGAAAERFAAAMEDRPRNRKLLELRIYALSMAGRPDEAKGLAREAAAWLPRDDRARWYREWMKVTFGLEPS
jgi:hypothetical protein